MIQREKEPLEALSTSDMQTKSVVLMAFTKDRPVQGIDLEYGQPIMNTNKTSFHKEKNYITS